MKMQNWIGTLIMLAFVVTTIPSISHASMSHDKSEIVTVKSEQAGTPTHEGCAGHGGQKQEVHKKYGKKDSPGKCCDGKVCKCLGNACNGPVKILGSNNFGFLFPPSANALFVFDERIAASDFHTRIKRPPRT